MVIPCYNSEKTIKSVVDRIISIFEDCHYEWEMVLVNDCSKDGTWEKIVSLAREHSNITGISLAKNSGQHAAILAGFRQCTGSVILCSDDDGQTPVENIPRMVNMLLENNYDVVSAKYIGFEKKDSIRKLGTALYHVIFNAMLDKPADVELRVFMAAKKFVIDEVCKYTQPYTSVNGLILRVTHNIGNVEMVQHKRMEGRAVIPSKSLSAHGRTVSPHFPLSRYD
jgi:undecaprenyl-phosphate 4-deoxy-4-formamido-L-arabinose transferase